MRPEPFHICPALVLVLFLPLSLSLRSQPVGPGDPGFYRSIPPDENSWQIVKSEILDPYFYHQFVEANPQRLPQSAENPLGYAPGVPWPSERGAASTPVPGLDIQGPDGLIYPNFSLAGVQGGIPTGLPVRSVIKRDNGDFAGQLEAAIRQAAQAGGGVVQIEAGIFILRRPVCVDTDRIVIRGRGAGPGGTDVRAEFGFNGKNIIWQGAADGGASPVVLGPRCELAVQALVQQGGGWSETPPPYGSLSLSVDGKTLVTADGEALRKTWFVTATGIVTCSLSGQDLIKQGIAPGKHTAVAVAKWGDGEVRQSSCDFVLDPGNAAKRPLPRGMLEIRGGDIVGAVPVSAPLPRGTTSLAGVGGLNLAVGDFVRLHVTNGRGWLERHKVTNDQSFLERDGIFQISAVLPDGGVTLNQPLRFTVEADEAVRAEKMEMVQGCGIEDLAITTPFPNLLCAVYVQSAANCWARNLRIVKPGAKGLWERNSKWIEVRNLDVDDGWYKGGGMAYIGWEQSFDCLLDGVKGRALRHAPNIQYSSSGCVIRNGNFEDSDGQFHSGWPHENLIENCTIRSHRGNGAYGFGFLFPVGRQPGPRNVLYNNDIESDDYPALFVGGPCEGSMFLYNRFHNKKGPSVYLQYGAFNQTFLGNYFISDRPQPGFVFIASPDCTGNQFVGNQFGTALPDANTGPASLFAGAIPPETARSNARFDVASAGRPSPAVPSLYEWEVSHLRGKAASTR